MEDWRRKHNKALVESPVIFNRTLKFEIAGHTENIKPFPTSVM